MKSYEQQARDLLERYALEFDLKDAQSLTAGDVVELANIMRDADAYNRKMPTLNSRK
jgi:hypothetical protein